MSNKAGALPLHCHVKESECNANKNEISEICWRLAKVGCAWLVAPRRLKQRARCRDVVPWFEHFELSAQEVVCLMLHHCRGTYLSNTFRVRESAGWRKRTTAAHFLDDHCQHCHPCSEPLESFNRCIFRMYIVLLWWAVNATTIPKIMKSSVSSHAVLTPKVARK